MKNKKWISLAAAVILAVTALPATVFAAKDGESKEELTKVTLNEVAHSILPETITMDNLVLEFKKRKGQMAIVVDEFGGTSGLVTLEDVIEEIFGDVQDEFDVEEEETDEVKEVAPNTYIANSMMRLDEFAEFFGINEKEIDDDDIDTIGGLVVKLLGRIAEVNDTAEFNNLTFVVKEVDGARITKLEIIKHDDLQKNEEKHEEEV